MQSLIVLASLVSELAGGSQNDPPPQSLTSQKHLSPLRVKGPQNELKHNVKSFQDYYMSYFDKGNFHSLLFVISSPGERFFTFIPRPSR